MESVTQALNIKIEALQEQAEWMQKLITKLRNQVKEKDEKIQQIVSLKANESGDLEIFKNQLEDSVKSNVEQLQELLQEKEFELDIQKADNLFLREKLGEKMNN